MMLIFITASFAIDNKQAISITRNYSEATKAQAIAESGIYIAIAHLLSSDSNNRWHPDGSMHEQDLNPDKLSISILDQASRISLNYAPKQVLDNLFKLQNIHDPLRTEIITSIVDLRNSVSEKTESISASETITFVFNDITELLQIKEMTPETFYAVTDALTIFSNKGTVNPTYSNSTILNALSLQDNNQGSSYNTSVDNSPDKLLSSSGYTSLDTEMIYRIFSQAETKHGGRSSIQAVISLTGNTTKPYNILDWQFSKL